jgi:signal transduction histidine kinase
MDRAPVSFLRWPIWGRYGMAVALALLVVAGRLALDPWWGRGQNRHLVFLPTVLLSAFLGGFGPGLVSTGLVTAALDYFWTEPRHVLHANIELFLFFMISCTMCKLIGSMHAARARADAARNSREQVLAIVAHDLRNPLTTIRMTSASLNHHPLDHEALRRRLEAVDRAVARMDNLIRDLIDATQMEHGEFNVVMKDENAAAIVQEVADSFGPVAREKHIAMRVPPALKTTDIFCDKNRVLQALGNLVGNALKFTGEGGSVSIQLDDGGDHVCFIVEDSGPGIKPEHLPHIFERYWRSDRRGTGLGLFIAQSIAYAHRGKIEVQSAFGHGATFVFSIPRAVDQKAAEKIYGWRVASLLRR